MADWDGQFDIVYTWVDDSFPGYLELLNAHSSNPHDLNPNRTRDNLQLLRYSMRSVARYLPEARRIYVFTCRPQLPDWLDVSHPKIHLVHHDAVIEADYLPTFSSFSIVSHLHLLPGLSDKFFYFEDDILANSAEMFDALQHGGTPVVHPGDHWITPRHKLNEEKDSPWNLALANADAALSENFGAGPRRHLAHAPRFLERTAMGAALAAYPDLVERTRKNRFRAKDGIPPEILVPWHMVETGAASLATRSQARRMEGYASLENFAPWTWAQLKRIDLRRPLSITLNDSFENRPNPRVESMVRNWLIAKFPDPAPWERGATD